MTNNITVSSNRENKIVGVTADTAQYWSEKSREYAISENIVDNEDYSSKYYSKKSKEASDIATGAIDDIEASKAEFDSSYNTKSQALNTQYTGYVTELETKKTEALTDIASDTEDFKDLYNEYTTNITSQKTQAIQDITTKETQSIANVGSKETESVANITVAGEATIGSITTAKNSALAEINTADESALSDIGTALEEAKQEINDTKTGAIDDIINNAAGEALERIEQIETETTETITNTANNAVITINTAVTTGQNEINSTVTTSKQELNTIITNADTDLTNKINAANTDLTDKVTSAENNIENTATNATTAITNTKDTAINELNTIVNTANTTIDSKVTNVTNMETHVTELEASAEASAELAQKYAENPVDVPVVEGEYSAKHWAQKAADVADVLENPMKNDMSNITETGVNKIKEIAGTVTPDIDVSNLADINLSNITIDGEKKIVDTIITENNKIEPLKFTLTYLGQAWNVIDGSNSVSNAITVGTTYDELTSLDQVNLCTFANIAGTVKTIRQTSNPATNTPVSTRLRLMNLETTSPVTYDFESKGILPYVIGTYLPATFLLNSTNNATKVRYIHVGRTAPSHSINHYSNIPFLWLDNSGEEIIVKEVFASGTINIIDATNLVPLCNLSGAGFYPINNEDGDVIIYPGGTRPANYITISNSRPLNIDWFSVNKKFLYNNLDNISEEGKQKLKDIVPQTTPAEAAHAASPSSRYIDFTVGASNTTYTVPADGIMYFTRRQSQAGLTVFLYVVDSSYGSSGVSQGVLQTIKLWIKVSKNDVVRIYYEGAGDSELLRFIYDNGAESEE